MFCDQYKKTEKGFTLIEMIVAVFVFTIVVVIASGGLLSVIHANRKAQALKSVMSNLNFAMESMTRSIRTGTRYSCGGGGDCADDGSTIFNFIDSKGRSVEYSFIDGSIIRTIDDKTLGLITGPITAPEVNIDSMAFYADGVAEGDSAQPRVFIIIKGTAGTDNKSRTSFSLETLVSQRLLDS